MADKIPLNVHFIWVGNKLPPAKAWLILTWAVINTKYTVILWTNRQSDNAGVLKEAAGTYKALLRDPQVTAAGLSFTVMAGKKAIKRTILCMPVGTLEKIVAEANLRNLYNEFLNEEKNYGGASDLLRIAALQYMGGIYADTDTALLKEIPQLSAKDGILFGTFSRQGNKSNRRTFVNAVIAAPQGHKYLAEIAKLMADDYAMWERRLYLSDYKAAAEKAHSDVVAAREKLRQQQWKDAWNAKYSDEKKHQQPTPPKTPPVKYNLDEKKLPPSNPLQDAKTAFQHVVQSKTLNLSGPNKISFWLYAHVGGSITPDEYIRLNVKNADPKTLDRGLWTYALEQYKMLIVDAKICAPAYFTRYEFPPGYVRIDSEGELAQRYG